MLPPLRQVASAKLRKAICNITSLIRKHQTFLSLLENSDIEDSSDGNITFDIKDRIGIIDISNCRLRNAISGRMMVQLGRILDSLTSYDNILSENKQLSVLVIKSRVQDTFCAGASFSLVRNKINSPENGVLMANFMTDCLNRLRACPLISVTLIDGPAVGGGSELATTSDFRIMTSSQSSRVQFIHAKLGASPGWGGAR